jgi:hypothetical protein
MYQPHSKTLRTLPCRHSLSVSLGYEVKEGQHSVGGIIPPPMRGRGKKKYPLTDYSTVTDLAKFLGWSTSVPFNNAT